MKVLSLLLQVLFVGAGILVYDALRPRAEDAPLGGAPARPDLPSTLAPADVPPEAAPVRLEGGSDVAWRGRVEDRLRTLEAGSGGLAQIADGVAPSGEPTATPEADLDALLGLGGGASDPQGAVEGGAEGSPASRFTPLQMATFRALLEDVERERRRERMVGAMNRALDRSGVKLTEDQRQAVLEATFAFQARARETLEALPGGEEGREARRAAFQDLRVEYQRTLEAVVPAAEAERIVAGLGRMGGGGGDGERPPRFGPRSGATR